MRARLGRWTKVLASAVVTACGPARDDALPRAACDVVVVSLDTTRTDALDLADPAAFPHLARLAARGVTFSRAVAGSSWTLPSHVQLVTGLPPALHGVHDDTLAIDPRHATLGEALAARGMRAFGVFTGWYLAGPYGFARGYEQWVSAMASDPAADRELAERLSQGGEAALWAGDLRAAASHADVSSARAIDRALELLALARPDERVHLFVHLFDPHYDYVPPPPFDARFDPDYPGTLDGRDYWRNPRIWDARRDPPRVVSDRDLEHVRALYRGEVAWCDDQLGRLFAALEACGRLEHALVVVTSDHGEEFFEHGNRGHRQTLYEESLRVPLLIVPPTTGAADPARRGGRCEDLVALDDVLPTVLDYVGGPVPATVWGRSLRPWVEGADLAPRPALASLGQITRARTGERSLRMLEALHMDDEVLIRRVALAPDGEARAVESVEWFDVRRDPGERERVDPADPQDEARARAAWEALEATTRELRAFAARLPRSRASQRATDVRAVFAHELGALGYAGDDEDDPDLRLGGARWPLGPLAPLAWPAAALGAR